MRLLSRFFTSVVVALTLVAGPMMVFAQTTKPSAIDATIGGLGNTASEAGLTQSGQAAPDLLVIVGNFIQAGLGLLGVAFMLIAIYAGAQLLGGDDPKKLAAARGILVNAVIGMVIIFSAYAIANFVIGIVTSSTSSGA